MRSNPSGQSGFSLIELMIAMVVTLVISASIYGLIAQSNTAFKIQPELADRQQNIRVAMDVIQRDLQGAGVNLGLGYQVFLQGLDGTGPVGASGANTDALQFVATEADCPDVPALNGACPGATCPYTASFVTLNLATTIPTCYQSPGYILVDYGTGSGRWGIGTVVANAGNNKGTVTFASVGGTGADIPDNGGLNVPATAVPSGMSALDLIRYEIANIPGDTDPSGNPIPGLWRSRTGGHPATGGAYSAAPAAAGNWQLLARGIDDLQVKYITNDPTTPLDNPPASGGTATTVVQQVRITLSARTITVRGTNTVGGSAIRGQLTSVSTIRSALFYLSGASWQ